MNNLSSILGGAGITVWDHDEIRTINENWSQSSTTITYTADRVSTINGKDRKFKCYSLKKLSPYEILNYLVNANLNNFSLDKVVHGSVRQPDTFRNKTAHYVNFAAW